MIEGFRTYGGVVRMEMNGLSHDVMGVTDCIVLSLQFRSNTIGFLHYFLYLIF